MYGWHMVQDSLSLDWLSQANHIFSRLRITSNFEDYGASPTHVPCRIGIDF
jgi:hypothetical protein